MSRFTGIKFDEQEFLKMAKRRARKDLGKYLRRGTIPIDIRGKKIVTIPMDWFDIPYFKYGFPGTGVGQGEGKPGDDLGPTEDDDDGEGKGNAPGGHGEGPLIVEVDFTVEEFTDLFAESLELPRIKPKGDRSVEEEREKYNTISRVGPKSQIHEAKTYDEAIKRSIAQGTFHPPEKMVVIPEPRDFWFKSWNVIKEPKNNAVVFYIRDISGSMGPEETRAARYLCALCSFWLSRNYDGLEEVYVVHHGEGWEVTKEEFFSLRSGGGTEASKGHEEAYKIVDKRFPVQEWNIYFVYLSDGLNFSSDNAQLEALLREKVLAIVNQYNYGEINSYRSWWGAHQASGSTSFSEPGTIGHIIESNFGDFENVALAQIESGENCLESVIEAIKIFFRKGR